MTIQRVALVQAWNTELGHEVCRGCYRYSLGLSDMLFITALNTDLPEIGGWELDGLISATYQAELMAHLAQFDRPMVLTGVTDALLDVPQVDADHVAAGRVAAEHLLGLGYRRFAVMGVSKLKGHRDRSKGFIAQIEEAGMSVVSLQRDDYRDYAAWNALTEWVQSLERPIAVFCTWDWLAQRLIVICRYLGIPVPDDIAVLGCENDHIQCEGIKPMVSSVKLPYRKVGFEATRLVDQWLKGDKPPADRLLIPPLGVEARMSTNHLAIDDEQVRRAVDYIRRHCDQKLDVETIARHSGLSLRQMQRRFKLAVGHSAARELQVARVELVKRFLSQTDMPMSHIAELTGYANEFYLGKSFKKIAGTTPSAYRQQYLIR